MSEERSEKPVRQRLFFALWPDEAVRNQLLDVQSEYALDLGRPVPPENLHVTLVFLGEQSLEVRTQLEAAAGQLAAEPFVLRIDSVNHWHRARLLWAGPSSPPEALMTLAESLRQVAQNAGVAVERRPYRPHVSLMRKTMRNPLDGARYWLNEVITWPVEQYSLVQSTLSPAGPRYRVLRSWPLRGT